MLAVRGKDPDLSPLSDLLPVPPLAKPNGSQMIQSGEVRLLGPELDREGQKGGKGGNTQNDRFYAESFVILKDSFLKFIFNLNSIGVPSVAGPFFSSFQGSVFLFAG